MSWFFLEPRGKTEYLISSLKPLIWIVGLFFSKNQVGGNSEGTLKGPAFGVLSFCLLIECCRGCPVVLG